METMVVEKTSTKFGPSFMVKEVWYVADKKERPDLSPIKPGDTIEVERNEKWVKSFKIVKSNTETPQKAQGSHSSPARGSSEVQGQICRGNAVNAILGSPSVAQMIEGKDMSEGFQTIMDMVSKTANYISSGEWK